MWTKLLFDGHQACSGLLALPACGLGWKLFECVCVCVCEGDRERSFWQALRERSNKRERAKGKCGWQLCSLDFSHWRLFRRARVCVIAQVNCGLLWSLKTHGVNSYRAQPSIVLWFFLGSLWSDLREAEGLIFSLFTPYGVPYSSTSSRQLLALMRGCEFGKAIYLHNYCGTWYNVCGYVLEIFCTSSPLSQMPTTTPHICYHHETWSRLAPFACRRAYERG